MATVTGTLKNASGTAYSGTICFSPIASPGDASGVLLTGGVIEAECDVDGAFSASLVQGYYHTSLDGTSSFRIYVGSNTTYDIADLIGVTAPEVSFEEITIWSPDDGEFKKLKLSGAGSEVGIVITD